MQRCCSSTLTGEGEAALPPKEKEHHGPGGTEPGSPGEGTTDPRGNPPVKEVIPPRKPRTNVQPDRPTRDDPGSHWKR